VSTEHHALPPITAHDAPSLAAGLRRIIGNGISLLLAYGLPRIFTIAAVIVAARVLGTRNFGAYGTAGAYAVILSILATLGMMPLLIRDIARAPDHAPRLLRAAHLVKVFTNSVMLITLWVVATQVLHYPAPVVMAALLLGISYAIGAFAENLAAYFQAVERMHVWMQASALFGLVSGGVGAALVLTTRSMVWFCVGPIVGQLASLLWLMSRAPAGVRHGDRADAADIRRMVQSLVPFAFAFIAMTIYYKADVLLLARWRAPEDVGEYTAAYKFVDILQALAIVAASAVYPRLARAAPRAVAGSRWAGTRVSELMLLATVPVACGLWLLRHPLIHMLYGAEYAGSVSVLSFLALAIPALGLNILAGYLLGAAGRIEWVALMYGLAAVMKIGLNVMLIPANGTSGAAIAMLSAECVLAVMLLAALRHGAAAAPSSRTLIVAGCSALACMVAAQVPDPTAGLIRAPLYACAVLLLYRTVKVLPERELAALRQALRSSSPADGQGAPQAGTR
jgi:O-antigen/teichoic acid export membrane protein